MARESTPLLRIPTTSAHHGNRKVTRAHHHHDHHQHSLGEDLTFHVINNESAPTTRRRNHQQHHQSHQQSSSSSPLPSLFSQSQPSWDDKKETSPSSFFQRISIFTKNTVHDAFSSYTNYLAQQSQEEHANKAAGHEYYEDHYNDLPWRCSFGTSDKDGVWMNTTDISGIIMASMVWIMICKFYDLRMTFFPVGTSVHLL